MRVGVDTGGTFTDLVADDGTIRKVPSTPADPGAALRHATDGLTVEELAHGTTVATNALLERRGARVALVTTEGFADVIEIARQVRPSLYDPFADRPDPLVPRDARYEARERVTADGEVLVALDASTLPKLAADTEAVAIAFLHADLHPAHERVASSHYRALGFDVTCSHEVAPETREYERTVTTVANAYLRPALRRYLLDIDRVAPRVLVMTSAGGLVPVSVGAELPAALLLSGPAGGARAAAAIASACGVAEAVAFDMGGTSTDVCLLRGGVPEPAPGRSIAGLPLRLPALDIHTIGAGGGSIAAIDSGGALTVGPRSAGAAPGPACYGRGGAEATVTDADLVLGRIPHGTVLPEIGELDVVAAQRALARAGVTADGVLALVDTHMAGAVRAVTVERGVDPRNVALVAFGGAGPLHACAVAEQIGIATVIVPSRAGVFSAVGLIASPERREVVVSVGARRVADVAAEARTRAHELLAGAAAVDLAYDCRYVGQSHELTVDSVDAFGAAHEARNGYRRDGAPVEVIAVRARATGPTPEGIEALPAPNRDPVQGPAVVAEPDCTIWVPEGWTGEVGALGAFALTRAASPEGRESRRAGVEL
ncbi:MAG TPA: hydantoinase/oxoprolinase family protein [Acidimicrobiia bacterium]|jgi:N-methylhydantoinase A/oxoprolinase/acetone carboxylase beta subunit